MVWLRPTRLYSVCFRRSGLGIRNNDVTNRGIVVSQELSPTPQTDFGKNDTLVEIDAIESDITRLEGRDEGTKASN